MKRDLRLTMYDDLQVDVYFDEKSTMDDIPTVCYVHDPDQINSNEIIFLVDESASMDIFVDGVNKWYWAKELVIKQIIKYLGDYVTYSYMSSESNKKLIYRFNKSNAITWINNRPLRGGWDFNKTLQDSHTIENFNPDATLIIVTSGENCVNSDWLPDYHNGFFFKNYLIINFDDIHTCEMSYIDLYENFNITNEILKNESFFNYYFTSNEQETNDVVIDVFGYIVNKKYIQQTSGIPNTDYLVLSPAMTNGFFMKTDDSGQFINSELSSLSHAFNYSIGYNGVFKQIERCVTYSFPELPVPNPQMLENIPSNIIEYAPTSDLYVHISSTILGGRYISGQITKINEPVEWCDIVGSGEYDSSSLLLTNVSNINSIAVSSNVRLIVYESETFLGHIILDVVGPVLINNNKFNYGKFKKLHEEEYEDSTLQSIYPQKRRSWMPNLDNIINGSIKIIFLETP